jgi:hypothetical protein
MSDEEKALMLNQVGISDTSSIPMRDFVTGRASLSFCSAAPILLFLGIRLDISMASL